MAEAVPTIYLFYGNDDLAISETLSKLLSKFEDSATAELNTTHLDGRNTTPEELISVAYALPFMADRRLVILEHPFTHLKDESAQERFTEVLDQIPPTTALVLIEHSSLVDYRGRWLKDASWIGKWLDNTDQRTFTRDFSLPKGGEMVAWIIKRTASMGGVMDFQAASELASLIGDNTRQADQEIAKLLDYVNYERPVVVEDVKDLTPDAAQVEDFALVNALRERNANKAQAILHKKLEVEEPSKILGSMIYQFRSLLLAREIIDKGGSKQDAIKRLAKLKISPYPAGLAYENTHRFSRQALQEIYHRLLDIDESIKTGKMDVALALDLFTVQVTN